MSGDTEATSASVKERVEAAGQLVQTMGQAGIAKLRTSLGGFGRGRASNEAAEAGTGTNGGGTMALDSDGTRAAALKAGIRQRLARLTGSRLVFNSAIGFLALLALAQWSLIVFNYWR